MAGFEQLIRETIAQRAGEAPSTRSQRDAVYTSSRAALERMLAGNASLDADAADAQRDRLETAIAQIEADLGRADEPLAPPTEPDVMESETVPPPLSARPPAPMPPSARREPETPAPPDEASVPDDAPMLSARREPALGPVPPLSPDGSAIVDGEEDDDPSGATEPVVVSAPYRGKALREPKPYARMLMWAIVLAGIGVAGWWAYTFGPELLRDQIDGSVPNPVTTVDRGAFVPEGGSGWLTVYMPGEQPAALVTADRGTAQIAERGTKRVARLVSSGPSETGNILLRLPDGVIDRISGRAATFEIMLAGAEGGGQQIAIYCDFGPLGECGRKRFATEDRREALVFDVLLERAELASGKDAYLAFNTDLGGEGRSIDLESVRVRVGS